MPNLNQGDKLLFTVWATMASQRILNTQVLSYNTSIGGPDDYVAFATAYCNDAVALGGIVDTIGALCSNHITFERVGLQLIYPNRYAAQFAAAPAVTPIAGNPAPVNSAAVVTKHSLIAKRYGIGSWHQAGFPAAKLDATGSLWDATQIANLQTALSNWFTAGYTPTGMNGNVDPVLWSIKNPTRTTFIESWQGQRSVRTMHRRTLLVGE